jgi:hypothetical protein
MIFQLVYKRKWERGNEFRISFSDKKSCHEFIINNTKVIKVLSINETVDFSITYNTSNGTYTRTINSPSYYSYEF